MKRIKFIDSLRGLAIFLVLWGHAIQYLRNDIDYFHDPVFEFIYSFHMPLFFLISGFFFKSSLKADVKEFVYKKFMHLLLPCFVWAVLFLIAYLIFSGNYNINFLGEFKKLVNPFAWPFWFLRELFITNLILYALYKIVKIEWLVFILSIILILIAPRCDYQRFLLPFFLIGIFLKDKYQYLSKYNNLILVFSMLIFAVSLFFWSGDYTIYKAKLPQMLNFTTLQFNFSNISIAAFRLLIGTAGSLTFFTLFQKLYKENWFFSKLDIFGSYTLGVYILQTTILTKVLNNLIDFSEVSISIYELIITPLIALAVLIVCISIIRIIRNRYLKIFLFGAL